MAQPRALGGKGMGVCCLGLGLTQAWLWLVFLSGPLLSGLPDAWGAASRLSFTFLAFHALTFGLLALRTSPTTRPAALVRASAVAMAAATAVLALPPSVVSVVSPPGRIALAAAGVAAVVGAAQVVLWGVFYSTLSGNRRIVYYAGSVVVGTIAVRCLTPATARRQDVWITVEARRACFPKSEEVSVSAFPVTNPGFCQPA